MNMHMHIVHCTKLTQSEHVFTVMTSLLGTVSGQTKSKTQLKFLSENLIEIYATIIPELNIITFLAICTHTETHSRCNQESVIL